MKGYLFISFRSTVTLLTVFLSSLAASDPCSQDSSCIDIGGKTDFSNNFHYVFIGAHPDDELLMYPQLKDFCAESNAYCAVMIATRGETGCEPGVSYEACSVVRSGELASSSLYLETDVWMWDFPTPSTSNVNAIISAYNQKAIEYSYPSMVEFLKQKIRPMVSSTSHLVVVTHSPEHGTTGHPAHLAVANQVKQAITELHQEGLTNIVALKINSQLVYNPSKPHLPYLVNDNTPNAVCRNGTSYLTQTNTGLTNYEVLSKGYYDIYPSQIHHLGSINSNQNLFEFCYAPLN